MSDTVSTALISVTAYTSDGLKLLKEAVSKLRDKVEIATISSVYKVRGEALLTPQIHDLRSIRAFEGLCAAVEAQTSLTPLELLKFLQEIEVHLRKEQLHRNISLNLLLYEDQTYMTQSLTLPYPDLHLRPELLIPGAEVWGEAAHPVLGKSLTELARLHQNKEWGEFFAQGQSLLDF